MCEFYTYAYSALLYTIKMCPSKCIHIYIYICCIGINKYNIMRQRQVCVIFASGMFFCIYKICIYIYIDTVCVYSYGIYLCYCHLHCRCCCLVTCDNLIRGNHQFKLYIPHHTYVVDFVIPLTIHTIPDMRPAAHI